MLNIVLVVEQIERFSEASYDRESRQDFIYAHTHIYILFVSMYVYCLKVILLNAGRVILT